MGLLTSTPPPQLEKMKNFFKNILLWRKKKNIEISLKKKQEIETIKNTQKKQLSNMMKMRNVGAQTQKKWRSGGPRSPRTPNVHI